MFIWIILIMMKNIKFSIILAECERCKNKDNVLLINFEDGQKTLCSKCLTEIVNNIKSMSISCLGVQ